MLVRLQPFGNVYCHFDRGSYCERRDRFNMIVQSSELGSLLTCGDETQVMKDREVWLFNNNLHHQALNLDNSWRVKLIFDCHPTRYRPSNIDVDLTDFDDIGQHIGKEWI